jgi:hypothetical protein
VGTCRRADGSCRRCRGGGGSRSPRHRRDHRHHPRFGPPALCTCPRPSSVGVGEGKVAAASAPRPSLLQFGHPERGSLSLLPERATASHPSVFCCSAGPQSCGVVRTCGGCRCFGSDLTPGVAPQGVFRSRTVSTTVAKWFVPDARGTVDNVYRFGPLRDA